VSQVISGIIFSYNRAMQLDATLRSFYLHCRDASSIHLTVLFRTDSPRHASQYRTLVKDYPEVFFIPEKNFRNDTIKIITASLSNPFVRLLLKGASYLFNTQHIGLPLLKPGIDRLAHKLQGRSAIVQSQSNNAAYILFLVDDNIFIQDFLLSEATQASEAQPEAIGFSLRLGRNTTYSYTRGRDQSLPAFMQLNQKVLSFTWPESDGSFGYPLEVSSSIYRASMICPMIASLRFHQPNKLEGKMANCSRLFRETYPQLLCFETSVTFCNPVNMVQMVNPNRAGQSVAYTVDELAERFERGERINVKALDSFIPKSCHQEVEIEFT
jgi:hypothetical protein